MSLQGKIEEIGRWNDRVKSPCDPFAHPVFFFRTIPKSPKNSTFIKTRKQTKSNKSNTRVTK